MQINTCAHKTRTAVHISSIALHIPSIKAGGGDTRYSSSSKSGIGPVGSGGGGPWACSIMRKLGRRKMWRGYVVFGTVSGKVTRA